jgi:hypothetical protein
MTGPSPPGLVFGFVPCTGLAAYGHWPTTPAVNGLRATPAHRDYLEALLQALSAHGQTVNRPHCRSRQ